MKIIGLAGTHGSGKDTVAELLADEYNFCHISTGDIVREIAMEKHGSVERPVLYVTANELRHEQGYGVLGKIALERFEKVKDKYKGLIISGLRAVAEADVIKQAGGEILYIDAPKQVRFERMKNRAREKEAQLTHEDFQKREDDENGGVDPKFNIHAIKEVADSDIMNDEDLQTFITKIKQALGL